jgi:hypothetical protein
MLVMKHDRTKLVTFRTKEWMEESKKSEMVGDTSCSIGGDEQEQRAANGSGWRRKKGGI